MLEGIEGTADVMISRSDYQPEYQVDFDREKLAIYGLNLTTAANYLRNRINGSTASYFREDGEEYVGRTAGRAFASGIRRGMCPAAG